MPVAIKGPGGNIFLVSQVIERDLAQEYDKVVPKIISQPRRAARMMARFKMKARKRKENWRKSIESKLAPQQRSELDQMPLIGEMRIVNKVEIDVGREEDMVLTTMVADWLQEKISRKGDEHLLHIPERGSVDGLDEEEDEEEDRIAKGDGEALLCVFRNKSMEDVSRGEPGSVIDAVDDSKRV